MTMEEKIQAALHVMQVTKWGDVRRRTKCFRLGIREMRVDFPLRCGIGAQSGGSEQGRQTEKRR